MLHFHPTAPIRLRPERGADESFVRTVYASTRADELALLGWSEQEKRQFVEMQFRAQSIYYRAQFPDACFLIIEDGDSPIGRLYLDDHEHEIRVIDIALLPEHRRKGIGGRLLEEIQAQAIALSKAVRIHVERFNPAFRLYQRLGFQIIEDQGVYWLMEWAPATVGAVKRPACAQDASHQQQTVVGITTGRSIPEPMVASGK